MTGLPVRNGMVPNTAHIMLHMATVATLEVLCLRNYAGQAIPTTALRTLNRLATRTIERAPLSAARYRLRHCITGCLPVWGSALRHRSLERCASRIRVGVIRAGYEKRIAADSFVSFVTGIIIWLKQRRSVMIREHR